MKIYHMIIEKGGVRREYKSEKQGASPAGWRCIGVCGYHDEPKKANDKNRSKQ